MKKNVLNKGVIIGIEILILACLAGVSVFLGQKYENGYDFVGHIFTERVFRKYFVCAAFIIAVRHLAVANIDFCRKYRNEIFFAILIILLTSLPVFLPDLKFGDDLQFHLNRIEGLYQGIKSGAFPVKIQPNWFCGAGYATGVMYGDLFLYFPAFLRLAGFEIDTAYRVFLFFVNTFTVLVAIYSYRRIFHDLKTGMFCSFLYSTAAYRMINLYRRSAVGEYIGMSVLPLICLAVIKIYETGCEDKEENKKIVAWLTIGMSILVQNHVLSTEMTVICLAVVCLVFWRKTFRKKVLLVYGKAILGTLALSLYFLVPFLDYSLNVDMHVGVHLEQKTFSRIWGSAMSIGRYFNFFYSNFTDQDVQFNFTPGIVLMGIFIAAIYLFINGKLSRKGKYYFWFALVWLIVASKLFPWNVWGSYTHVGFLMSQVQSAWRYVTYAICFLTLLSGEIYVHYDGGLGMSKKTLTMGSVILVMLTILVFSSAYDEFELTCHYKETGDLDSYDAGAWEYVPVGANLDDLPRGNEFLEHAQLFTVDRNGCKFWAYIKADAEGGFVEFPLFLYKGYQAMDQETRAPLEIMSGNNAVIRVMLPPAYEGTVLVDFYEPWYWRAAEILSFASAAGMAAALFIHGMRKRKKEIRTRD